MAVGRGNIRGERNCLLEALDRLVMPSKVLRADPDNADAYYFYDGLAARSNANAWLRQFILVLKSTSNPIELVPSRRRYDCPVVARLGVSDVCF
jgi:hypothetical protein